MSMEKALATGKDGGLILFCGSGFSSDCLTFANAVAGTMSPLHHALNSALEYEFSDVQLAADEYLAKFGQHALLALLREKYSISRRTAVVDAILRYPWDRIYTTNYDDVISQSLTASSIEHYAANNLEPPHDVKKHAPTGKLVVHLHGALRSWNNENFSRSCVLGRESYLRIAATSRWSPVLREDYARAAAIFFIGFSNSDFYLSQELYNAASSREKVYFINSEKAGTDRELLARQRHFGQSLAIGSDRFAEIIEKVMDLASESGIVTRSFRVASIPEAAPERASVQDQESFIMFGQSKDQLLFRDVLDEAESYRASRSHTERVVDFLQRDNAIALIIGGICSGKSLIFEEVVLRLCTEGRRVYVLRSRYYDLFEEITRIMNVDSNIVIAIDDCFTLREEMKSIVKLVTGTNASLLLASRSIAYDSEEDIRNHTDDGTEFRIFDTEVLDRHEAQSVVRCTDRIGGWGTSVHSNRDKLRMVIEAHSARLSAFLLNRFRSEHIRARFVSELDLFRSAGPSAVEALILAMYLRHIGEPVQEHVLSEMLGFDALQAVSDQLQTSPFMSFNPNDNSFVLLPSISARDALSQLFSDREVTTVVLQALANVAPARQESSYRRIFRELMRYTQLKTVVNDRREQDRFFDRLSEMEFCRRHVLFWLQWSMAMRDHEDYGRAEQYLDEAYGIARSLRNYDTYQLDDQKARLILDSVPVGKTSGHYLRKMREVHSIISRSIGRVEQTSHPYLTVLSLRGFVEKAFPSLQREHIQLFAGYAESLGGQIQKRIEGQRSGFIKQSMGNAKQCTKEVALACRKMLE